ncbi:uncharacterized protein EI97DRAFT_429132 [Westerdykella ornata]|uniref:Vacuolar import and degradation protein 21 n=1 Tax=Westerdykella ornata TaxID=318751 RepID=A0A6A6K129_WESOR|nr:uncharacterized protein EI97DRAFT_429132 [Westerdykella ornata]KAF2281049.1 hypothetical protein EI97DRAFT_429132 [Westerdykella ornata]
MSLDVLRDAYIREKKNEIAACDLSRKRKLRELYCVNVLVARGLPPQPGEWSCSEEPGTPERSFLDANDVSRGLRFDESTLPYPTVQPALPSTLPFQSPAKHHVSSPISKSLPPPSVHVPVSLEDQLRAASASPSVANPSSPVVFPTGVHQDATPVPAAPSESSPIRPEEAEPEASRSHLEGRPVTDVPLPSPAVGASLSQASQSTAKAAEVEVSPDGPSADPKLVVPPSAEDNDALAEQHLLKEAGLARPANVVHLPPQDVQEARLKETEKHLAQAREQDERRKEKLTIPTTNAHADVVSSPSSTVGPYSQATPHAAQHSPDTSPDRESFKDRTDAMELDPAARQAKEEHERALQKEMQEARERARGDRSITPEVERQLQQEEAIRLARDGKSRLDDSAGLPHSLTEHAEEVVDQVSTEAPDASEDRAPQGPSTDSLPTPATVAAETSPLEQETGRERVPISTRTDHPTPPADVDVEMGDAALPSQEDGVTSSKPEYAPQEHISKEGPQEPSVPEPNTAMGEETTTRKPMLTPGSSRLSAPSESPSRSRPRKKKRKEISTVVFAKPDPQKSMKALQLHNAEYAALQGATDDPSRDYLYSLFKYQAQNPPRSRTLVELVASASKTVSTAGVLAMLRESSDYKILKRVYQLQNANRWSLRQMQKSAEPPRPTSHLDHLLREMKWMQTDFKEERKWKRSLAATFAHWCAEYVNSSAEDRASLRIRARVPNPSERSNSDTDMNDAPTPDLVHSGANETESESFADDEELLAKVISNAPAGLFSLGSDDVVMKIDRTPASDSMLMELPMYEPNLEAGNDVTPVSFCDPPILPVSKFITGKLVSKIRGPPRKRSRYEYDSEDEPSSPPSRAGTSAEHSMPSTPGRRLFHRNDLPPEMTDVALFNPDNKHIRDRLHAAHQFKPPTEFQMPSVSFFENRTSSQWLWEEDQKLRGLVRDYTFNWSLVAQQLSSPSMFVSGACRRTPWECFERWVQLEGLPGDMAKTPYFRTYQNRLEQAQRTVLAQHQAQQQLLQQQGQQGQNLAAQVRRRTNQPIRVERRRDNRYLAIIDGMKKLAKRREQMAQKQADAAKAAALRRAAEPAQVKTTVHTPQEISRLKWEKEEKRNQQILQMKAQAARANLANMPGQPGAVNAMMATQRNGTPMGNAQMAQQAQMAMAAQHAGLTAASANMTPRPLPGQQGMAANFPNPSMNGMPMNNAGVPQAQMHASMQNNQRMGPPDQMRIAMQRGQFPVNNQHQFQLQQQQLNMANNLAANMNMGNGMHSANMMASMANQGVNGNMNASMNGVSNNAGSPRMNQVGSQMQSPGRPHIPQLIQIQNTLKAQNPDWPPEQVQRAASEHLHRFMAKQRVQAMNAAAGAASNLASSPQIGNNVYLQNPNMQNSPSPNPVQSYQQQLQQRMMSQRQQVGSPAMNGRPASRSATPQNPQGGGMQSPGAGGTGPAGLGGATGVGNPAGVGSPVGGPGTPGTAGASMQTRP